MEQQPWWKKDVDEMWAMTILGTIVVCAYIWGIEGAKEIALVAGGAFATYLGKGKNGNNISGG